MASFAEMMLAKGLENSTQVPDIAGSMAKGAELATHVQQVQTQRDQLEQQKADLRDKKIQEMTEDLQKVKDIPGGKALQGYKTFLNNKAMTYKVNDIFNKDTIDLITAAPENIERFTVLRDDVLNGRKTMQQAVDALKDPSQFYNITPNMLGDLYEASKTRVQANEAMNRAGVVAAAAGERQTERINAEPIIDQEKKTREIFTKLKAAGGNAAVDRQLEKLNKVLADIDSGKVQTGGFLRGISGKSSTAQATIMPELKAAKDAVLGAVPLKEQLADPNPSEFQIKDALSRAWDDALPTAENRRRVQLMIDEIKSKRAGANSEFKRFGLPPLDEAPAKKKFSDLSPEAQSIVIKKLMQTTGKDEQTLRKELEGR